jgi:ABC-type multidrug transport system fused ATPase/permease subunit
LELASPYLPWGLDETFQYMEPVVRWSIVLLWMMFLWAWIVIVDRVGGYWWARSQSRKFVPTMANANSTTPGQFWGTVLVCAVVLACANAVTARLTQHTVSRRILADARNSGSAQTIALGNSLVRSAFNAEEFAAAQQSSGVQSAALNMAMGSSTPAEHLLLLRAALRADDHARVLLYGFYDFQLYGSCVA